MKKLCLVIISIIGLTNGVNKLQERYNWNQLDFEFPSESEKQAAIASGDYIPKHGLPVGLEHFGDKIFVTVPRWKAGIPATLNYIDTTKNPSGSPALIPYPDLASNRLGDCENGLSTVYRIKVDKCNRLWVLDTGTYGNADDQHNVCPYAINIFDLNTNKRIKRYAFKPTDTSPKTFIANTVVDIGASCDDAFAYFSDELGHGLLVYSLEQNDSWRFQHSFFYPDPKRGDYNIGGLNFQWYEEGIFGMSISKLQPNGYRTLYFSPLASHSQFKVSTEVLRNKERVGNSYHAFEYVGERGPNSHTTSHVIDEDGEISLFSLIDQNAVGCWNTATKYIPSNHGIVDQDDVGLVFPSDVKVDQNKDVWVMSDRMQGFMITGLNYSDINFRIFSAPLQSLIAGTVCDSNVAFADRFSSDSTNLKEPAGLVQQPTIQIPQSNVRPNSRPNVHTGGTNKPECNCNSPYWYADSSEGHHFYHHHHHWPGKPSYGAQQGTPSKGSPPKVTWQKT